MQKYQNNVQTLDGRAIVGASVTVTEYPGGAPATVYNANGSGVITQPILTNGDGEFAFYAANGRYQLQITGGGISVAQTITDVILFDPSEAIDASEDAGDLAGDEFVPVSRGSGVLKTTLTAIADFIRAPFADSADTLKGATLVGYTAPTSYTLIDNVRKALDALLNGSWRTPFGSATSGVWYRPGTNYESAGTTSSQESRPFLHDFRPLGVADGGDALFSTDGCNLFIGPGAGNFTMRPVDVGSLPAGKDYNLQCSHNVGIGLQSLGSITIGYKNTGFGTNTWRKLTSGHGNTAAGRDAGHEMLTGNENSFYGFTAGQLQKSGNYNTATGAGAGYNNDAGSGNTYIGRRAGFEQTGGDYNTFAGNQAGQGFEVGDYNIFLGKQAASMGLTTGNSNTVVGSRVTWLQDESGMVVVTDGNGVPYFESHPGTSAAPRRGWAHLASRNTTAFDATATDGQVNGGSTVFLENLANVGNAICQLVARTRVGTAFNRIVASGGAAGFWSFIVNDKECLRIDASGNVLVRGAGGGALGYATGAGGSVSAAARGDAVTLNKPTGRITLPAGTMAAGEVLSFTLNNSLIGTADTLSVASSATTGVYLVSATQINAGSARITVYSPAASPSESISIPFCVIKGATA